MRAITIKFIDDEVEQIKKIAVNFIKVINE